MFADKPIMEIWKDVEGFEGFYQVSNSGKVKSLSRHIRNRLGNGFSLLPERILKPGCSRGYKVVVLSKHGVKVGQFKVHRLVAMAFISNPENKTQVNHINGDKSDNRLENLEWATPQENTTHAYNNGLAKIGVQHYKTKLTEKDVLEVLDLIKVKTIPQIVELTGLRETQVSSILNKRNWVRLKVA